MMSPDDAIALFWTEFNSLNTGTRPDKPIGESVAIAWDILGDILLAEDPEQRVRSRAAFEYHRQFVDRQTLSWKVGAPPRLIIELLDDFYEVLFQCCPLQCDLREIWEQMEEHGLPFRYNAMRSIAEELSSQIIDATQEEKTGQIIAPLPKDEISRADLLLKYDITTSCLTDRIKRLNHPKPIRRNGRKEWYSVREVENWLRDSQRNGKSR